MKKTDFIKRVVEVAEGRELRLTQVAVKELLDVMEDVIDEVIVAEDEVAIMGYKFTVKDQAARTGVSKMGDEPVEWSSPARRVPTVNVMKSKKDQLSKEI